MGIFDFMKEKGPINSTEEFEPLIVQVLREQVGLDNGNVFFKGMVENKKITFPKELGLEHPFDFAITEGLFKTYGFVNGVIDKYVDFVVGPGFYVKSDNEKAQTIIEQFLKDVNFDTLLRAWTREALVKGNGFIEIGGRKDESPRGLKIIDAKYMYVDRDKKGKILGYNQYTGAIDRFDKKKVIPFETYQIAHIPLNRIGDMAYGLGLVYSSMTILNNLFSGEKWMHEILKRKANSPYHIQMGKVIGGKYYKPTASSVTKIGKELEVLTNKTEWATDGLTDIKAVDFGSIGDKFEKVLEYDLNMLFYAFQIPPVIMGMGSVPEGLAQVQLDTFERKISSIQAELEKVIENDIFRRVLQANSIDAHVEFEWGRPSTSEKYMRLGKVKELLGLMGISNSLRKLLEKDVIGILGYDENEYIALMEEEEVEAEMERERQRELERSQPLVPGQNSKPPKPTPQEDCCPHVQESLHSYKTIKEWLGFNYNEYLDNILTITKEDKFELLAALSSVEADAGYLSATQVRELRKILEDGFKYGRSIAYMTRKVRNRVAPHNLYKVENGELVRDASGAPILIRKGSIRSEGIVRTEVTRLANEGAKKQYVDAGIEKVSWIASVGERTCPTCESYDGNIYEINNVPPIPAHPMCRCTLGAVTELG